MPILCTWKIQLKKGNDMELFYFLSHYVPGIEESIQRTFPSFLTHLLFIYLLDEQLSNLPSKGNDMELFHFLSTCPHVSHVKKEFKDVNDSRPLLLDQKRFSYPSKNNYKNN